MSISAQGGSNPAAPSKGEVRLVGATEARSDEFRMSSEMQDERVTVTFELPGDSPDENWATAVRRAFETGQGGRVIVRVSEYLDTKAG